jgi:hypothetical protein
MQDFFKVAVVGLAFGIAALFASCSKSDTESGTVVVFGLSKTKIVVAADSRATNKRTAEHDDSSCKFITLGNRFIFAATGAASYQGNLSGILGFPVSWSAEQEARLAFDSFQRSPEALKNPDVVGQVSAHWAKAMIARLSGVNDQTSFGWKPGEAVTSGLFAAIGPNGEVQFFAANIIGGFFNSISSARGQPVSPPVAIQFLAFGQPEVAQEFIDGKSERAIAEAKMWQKQMQKQSVEDRDWLTAVRYVELAIEFDASGDVGGHVEVAQLTPKDGIEWKQNPGRCPEN